MLDEVMTMGKQMGLYVTDYGVGVISVSLRAGQPDVGIWLHGDVVPAGDGWCFEPYRATPYRDCIIGRGAADNKGQLAAILNLFRVFQRLGLELGNNIAIYLGSNEESGMRDVLGVEGDSHARGFLHVAQPPRLSLVPDGGFPVGYGGKGGMNISLKPTSRVKSFRMIAGQDAAPGLATAYLMRADVTETLVGCSVTSCGQACEISCFTPPRHGSAPDPNGNMITQLASALLTARLLDEHERYILELFRDVSKDIHGELLGIKTVHPEMGALTVFSKCIDMEDDAPVLTLNIRYPLGITFEQICECVRTEAEKRGFAVSAVKRGVDPYRVDPNGEITQLLCRAANSVTGEQAAPYTMSGGTYAHVLPNAYVFGMSSNLPPDDFAAGRGGAHGVDEAVSVSRLKRGMKIYARALLALDADQKE